MDDERMRELIGNINSQAKINAMLGIDEEEVLEEDEE